MVLWTENNRPVNLPGLAQDGGDATKVATGNNVNYFIDNTPYYLAAGTLGAPTGVTIATGYKKVIGVLVDTAGVASFNAGPAIATASTVDFSKDLSLADEMSKCVFGLMIVDNNSGSDFKGGSTDLDATNVVTTYIDAMNAVF